MSRIIGIGIGEQFEIGWADLDTRFEYKRYRGHLKSTQAFPFQDLNDRSEVLDLPTEVDHLLTYAKSGELRHVFEADIAGVGFACIGRIDRISRRLIRVVRKNWKMYSDDNLEYMADFAQIASEHFPSAKVIVAENDATAAALAEAHAIFGSDIKTMFYITMNEGVNAGLIYKGRRLDLSEHSEFGHSYPRLHDHDVHSAPFAACKSHGYCYEAVASAARVRNEWGRPLEELNDKHEAWDILGYYGAQLCLAGHVIFAPERIVLGGTLLWGLNPTDEHCKASRKIKRLLLLSIRRHYLALRNDYPIGEAAFGRRIEPEVLAAKLIDRGLLYKNATALGALELARQALLPSVRTIPSSDDGI